MLPRLQAGQFQGALQLGLAPVAGGLLIPFEGAGEVGGLAVHLQAHFQHFLDLFLQQGIAPHRFGVNLVDPALETGDLLTEGF